MFSLQASFHIRLQPTETNHTDPDILHYSARIQEKGRGRRAQAITKSNAARPIHKEGARQPVFVGKPEHSIQRFLFINKEDPKIIPKLQFGPPQRGGALITRLSPAVEKHNSSGFSQDLA